MLTNYTIGDNLYISRLRESNSRPPAYKAGAITTMLNRQSPSVGIEPTTIGLKGQRSTI